MARWLGVCGACGGVSDWHRFYDFLRFTLVETHNMHKPEKKIKNQLMHENQHSKKTNGATKGMPVAHNSPHISEADTVISGGLV